MTNNLKLRIILNTLDKYNYCLDSELDEAHEQITDLMREAYETGKKRGMYEQECLEMGNLTGWTEDLFEEWIKL